MLFVAWLHSHPCFGGAIEFITVDWSPRGKQLPFLTIFKQLSFSPPCTTITQRTNKYFLGNCGMWCNSVTFEYLYDSKYLLFPNTNKIFIKVFRCYPQLCFITLTNPLPILTTSIKSHVYSSYSLQLFGIHKIYHKYDESSLLFNKI